MKRRVTKEHDARQAYDGVYWEAGIAITDADLNAALDANRETDLARTRAFLAPAGSPDDGWRATALRRVDIDGTDMVEFDLGQGHYTLDGAVLRNPAPYSFTNQPHGLSAALEPGMALAWPGVDEIVAAGGERFDGVVCDSRRLAVTVVEDSELDEVAMRSDPATRTRPSPKVRILTDTAPTCAEARPLVMDRLAGDCATVDLPSPAIRSQGRLRVHLGEVTQTDNACAPELALGYFGRLNHTIKVMLADRDRFVWAYRNGGELFRATVTDNVTLRLVTPFDDSSRFPVSGEIAEILTWDSRLPNGEVTAAALGSFHAISEGYAPGTETIELDTALPTDLQDWIAAQGTGAFVFVRFWEPPAIAMDTATDTGPDVPLADTGIRLDFTAEGCPGDQWTFSVRVNANDTVFPKRMLEPGGQPPTDIRRAADLIALIHWRIEDGEVTGHLHDCRRRIRPLWKQRGCCTVTVGDGSSSFGDVDRLEDALAALPHAGGRICLLPGTHQGGVTLRNLTNVTIEGCRGQTRLVRPGTGPALIIEDCSGITIRDFTIEDGRGLAIAAARTTRLSIERISTTGFGSALSLVEGAITRVSHCDIRALPEPAIIPGEEFATLRPLAFIGGRGLDISNNLFRCETDTLTLMSLGGLQISSGSGDVRIVNNVIRGGLGHGITLGHLNRISIFGFAYGDRDIVAELGEAIMAGVDKTATWTPNSRMANVKGNEVLGLAGELSDKVVAARERIANATFGFTENPIGITQVAVQGCLGINPTLTLPEPGEDDQDWHIYVPAGSLSHIHIRDNEILGMGGSGISVPSWNLSLRPTAGEIIVVGLIAERNHIAACARVSVATTVGGDNLHEIGFGGIALEVVRGAKIASNIIQAIGTEHNSPSVGIYLAEAQVCTIHDNEIVDIGRAERSGAHTIPGVSGGIVVDAAQPIWGTAVTGGRLGGLTTDAESAAGAASGDAGVDDGWGSDVTPSHGHGRFDVGKVAARAEHLARFFDLPRTDALRIQNNQVTVNFGLSLDVRGAGSFHIADNSLTTLASRPNPDRPRLSVGVSVVNTELPYLELLLWLMLVLRVLYTTHHAAWSTYVLRILLAAASLLARLRDPSVIQFQNNIARTEVFMRSEAVLALVAIVSPFDVQVSDNTLKSAHANWGALLHLFEAGLASTQCLSNRIETRPSNGVVGAALTVGRDNTTYLNHASHPLAQVRMTPAVPADPGNIAP